LKETQMANAEPIELRIVAYREGDAFAAQCLEYDIAAQGPDLKTLMRRIDNAICREAEYTKEAHGEYFAGLTPAPDYFNALFEEAVELCSPEMPKMPLNAQRVARIAA
jgi:hypothetical protein